MSKNAFHHPPKDQLLLDDQCKHLFRLTNEMKDDEHKFYFVHLYICAVENCMKEGELKKKVVKSMTSWALKEFNAKDQYRADVRMLDFWKLLGKYSSDLKMEGVMENLHRVGHFNTQPALYLMWAEHWASLDNRRNFEKIVAMCEKNCAVSSFDCKELFKPLISKYFGETSEETYTMALIKAIADRPQDVHRTLSMFPDRTVVNPPHLSPHLEEPQAVQIYEQQQPPLAENREDFSIFRDPATKETDEQAPSMPNRVDVEFLDQITAREPAPMQSMLCGDMDDITLSGAHGKFAPGTFTSTPRRSVAFCAFNPPLMELDGGALMGPSSTPRNKEERVGGGLFAPGPEVGVSKLQRRLSLVGDVPAKIGEIKKSSVNEIMRTLPNLKIGSTILEETEEETTTSSSTKFKCAHND